MPKLFVARKDELKKLEDAYKSSKSQLVAIYGRRRIGKSSLIHHFIELKDKPSLSFEGIENKRTPEQINRFQSQLADQLEDKFLLDMNFSSWDRIFAYLTEKVLKIRKSKKKLVLFFDEIQWMASKRSSLISLIKYYWDNHWQDQNIMLILCGSVASFMVDKVIFSKALYGRIDLEILLRALKPNEASLFFKGKKNKEEILKYLMLFGSIPKYLEIIKLNKSFKQNIEELCFSPEGFMFKEPKKIFYSQFKETDTYEQITRLIQDKPLSYKEIIDKLKIKSGGGFKAYINNLENAQIISHFMPSTLLKDNKVKKYKLTDEYLNFHFKYINPNESIIAKANTNNLSEKLCTSKWKPWLGLAFERFCLKNAIYLAEKMGFADEVIDYSPYFQRKDKGFQIDLLYVRVDKLITVCEIKYHESKISTEIIPQIEKKINLLPVPKGYTVNKALISLNGPDNALLQSEYFDYILDIDNLL